MSIVAKKAYLGVFGYQTFPFFMSDRMNFAARGQAADLRLGLHLVPAEISE